MSVTEENQLAIMEPTKEVAIALYTGGKMADFLGRMKTEVLAVVTDPTTDKGRKEIASLAYKVAKTKARLDDLGKSLTEEARTTINRVNEERRMIRDELDALKDEVRRPLTEFEEREKSRVAGHEAAIASIEAPSRELTGLNAASLKERLDRLPALLERDWQEYKTRAQFAHDNVTRILTEAHAAAVKYEAEQAELVRLRRGAEERARKDREEQIAREAAERARAEAEAKAKAEREAAERAAAEKARIERESAEKAAREAVEKAKREAEAKAAKERAEAEAKLKAEREAREKIEREQREAKAREEARIKAEKLAAEKAAAAPDREKLVAFAGRIRKAWCPECTSRAGKAHAAEIDRRIGELADYVEQCADAMGGAQ
jgi:hypothetical protein